MAEKNTIFPCHAMIEISSGWAVCLCNKIICSILGFLPKKNLTSLAYLLNQVSFNNSLKKGESYLFIRHLINIYSTHETFTNTQEKCLFCRLNRPIQTNTVDRIESYYYKSEPVAQLLKRLKSQGTPQIVFEEILKKISHETFFV